MTLRVITETDPPTVEDAVYIDLPIDVVQFFADEGDPGAIAFLAAHGAKYSPDQPRDDHGRFGSGGGLTTVTRGLDPTKVEPLTQEESDAVNWYTGPLNAQRLNEVLRNDGAGMRDYDEETIQLMDSAIAKSTLSDDPTYAGVVQGAEVYKGMVTTHDFQVGERFIDKGFISTTSDVGVAKQFAQGFLAPNKEGNHVLIHISVDPATQHYVPGADMIDEKILPRGMEFEVTKVVPTLAGVDPRDDPMRVYVTAVPK